MTTHFSFAGQQVSHDFADEGAAIAFAEQMVAEIAKWEMEPAVELRVVAHDGSVIFARRFRRILSPKPIDA